MNLQPYLADISGLDTDRLLDDWRWLLGDRRLTVFRATAMGDLILEDEAGQFHFLDVMCAKLQILAHSESELWDVLTDRRTSKTFLATFIVKDLRKGGVVLGAQECYSPAQPPVLGGSLSRDNLRPCDILVHASIMGQIHRQVKNLRPGQLVDITFKPDAPAVPDPETN
jgi:hypothetical protein